MTIITDRTKKKIEKLVNATIHELVFVNLFADQDSVEEADNALTTAEINIIDIRQILKKATRKAP